MRIAVIAPPWLPVPPLGYGGTEAVLDVLVRGLAEAGHDVVLHTTGDSTCPVERRWTFESAVGIEHRDVEQEVAHVVGAYEAARDADVVHDHTLVGPLHAAAFPNQHVVTTNHGPFVGPLAALYRSVATRVAIVAISHHQASTAGGIPIAAVIHHGLDVDATEVGAGDGGYALFLGRMSAAKGVDRAVRIARAAGMPLRIAAKLAEPGEHEYFAARVAPLLGGDVEYLGEVSTADKQALLRDAACLLNPIAWPEPFGMVMIEALATGTPVVVTPNGAAPELVDDGVTGFVRGDEPSLVRAVRDIESIDRAACRKAAEERFSATRVAADHLRLYEQVTSRTLAAHG